jgi:hypothetical protein
MIPWIGNLSFRVYSPDKPVKYGIKAYIWFQILPMAMFQNVNYTGKSVGCLLMFEVFPDNFVEYVPS